MTNKNPTFISSVFQINDIHFRDIILNQPNNQALTPQVIQRALDTIVLNQSFDGTWRDFDIPGMGMSSGWVTAHVALKLQIYLHLGTVWSRNRFAQLLNI